MSHRSALASLFIAVAAFAIVRTPPAGAQSLQPAITKVCGVMAGTIKPDGQALQFIMMMDGDMSDANPVALGLQTGVLSQCPKAYLAYKHRAVARNPFPAGSLVSNSPVNLLPGGPVSLLPGNPSNVASRSTTLVPGSTPESYAMRCRAGGGMATHDANTLILTFARPLHPAEDGLLPGQCGWITRNLRPGEPSRIEVALDTAKHAARGVTKMNAATGLWTYWVYNATTTFRATAVAKGTPSERPSQGPH